MSQSVQRGSAVPAAVWTTPGTAAHLRTSSAFFLAGYAVFSLLYCIQPLLPVLAQDFRVGPAAAALALSATTGCMAVAVLFGGAISENLGRRGLMFVCMCAAATCTVAAAVAPTWHLLLLARALEGLALGGVPSVAMAYLAEEIDPRGLGLTMGLFIGGNAFGGMAGRVLMGFLTEHTTWRVALATLGFAGLAAAFAFVALLPPSRNFVRQRQLRLSGHANLFAGHLLSRGTLSLLLLGFAVMGTFVTVYNYIGFRLAAPPYALSPSTAGSIFVIYLFGIVAASAGGAMADRFGRGPMVVVGLSLMGAGVAITLFAPLIAVVAGVVVFTMGFFVAHSVASAWSGAMATSAKAHAASLYVFAYYVGASVLGSAGGWFWRAGRWTAVAAYAGGLLVVALCSAASLWARQSHLSRRRRGGG